MSLFWKSVTKEQPSNDSQRKDSSDPPLGRQPSCGICFMPVTQNTKAILQPCAHCFHFDCIDRWLNMRPYCAYCRATQPQVRHNFTSSIEYSIKCYDDHEDSLDLDDMEILDYDDDEDDEEETSDADGSGFVAEGWPSGSNSRSRLLVSRHSLATREPHPSPVSSP